MKQLTKNKKTVGLKRALLSISLASALYAPLSLASVGSHFVYLLEIETRAKVPEWVNTGVIYGAWQLQGAPNSCSVWADEPSSVDWGVSFQQSRNCSQGQVRDVTQVLTNPVTKAISHGITEQEARNVSASQFQDSVGVRDYITGENPLGWSDWVDTGGHYACSSWTPDVNTKNLNEAFTQSRDCSQNQTSTQSVNDVWASGLETEKRIESNSQVISEPEGQAATGTLDFIKGSSFGTWTGWSANGSLYDCGAYSPESSTVTSGESFTQHSDCSQDEQRTRPIFDEWESGASTENGTETDARVVSATQSQPAVGSGDVDVGGEGTGTPGADGEVDGAGTWYGGTWYRNDVVVIYGTRTGDWTDWYVSSGCAFSSWTPSSSDYDFGVPFIQTQTCTYSEARTQTIYDKWTNNTETVNVVNSESRVVVDTVTRTGFGTGGGGFDW
jgi:hypothetical protein